MAKIDDYIGKRWRNGDHVAILRGGRRSGKTYSVLKFLLLACAAEPRTIVSVASMTSEQGRFGAFADARNIIELAPTLFAGVQVCKQPMVISLPNGSQMFFKSYSVSERAKGIACDYLFINEANNFSLQQYTDLRANVRLMTFLDYNPNVKFWVDDIFDEADICDSTWKDNPYLTDAQREYFADLKRLAERPEATSIDRRNYAVYYLGEYAELDGAIFTRINIRKVAERDLPPLHHVCVFCDPSALRGADWFAIVLSARDSEGNIYILDTISLNEGSREQVVRMLQEWCRRYDVDTIYIETNGIIGIDFFEFAENSGLKVEGWHSRGNKFDRIVARYQDITTRVFFVDSEANEAFLRQVYDFSEKCEHDDNIDAVASSVTMQDWGE